MLRWMAPAGLFLIGTMAVAQPPAGGDPPARPAVDSPDTLPADSKPAAVTGPAPAAPPFDIRYLEGPDGRPVFVPDKVRLDEFLNWLEQRRGRVGQAPPGVNVSSLSLEGTADDERAHITAQIELQVTQENAWVRVPLQMSEGTLRVPPVYAGGGLAVPAPYNPDEGYSWWIKGKGRHQLSLSLSIPLRKQAVQRRVQLSLPATAVSLLKLRVAAPHISARAPERSTVSTKTVGNETEIEVIGLGNRLDLTWQSLPDATGAETALEVTTSVIATLVDGESATLEATQLIQSLGQQRAFDEVRVSLPEGYELLRLEGQELRDHKNDADNPHQIVMQLKKPTPGPVELKWTVVRSKLPPVGEPFALEGFEVDRARLQTGYLAIIVVGDFRMIRQPDEDKFLQRVDLADLPGALRQTPASAAFRFLNRLLLRMKLQRIEPYVTVDPAILLHLSSDSIELEGGYRLQVLRGSIAGFKLRWPQWKKQGWTISEAELPGHIELRVNEEAGDPDVLRLEFAEPAKGDVEFRFRALRNMAEAGTWMPLTLPVPEAYGRFPTPLAVVSADNVEAELRPDETTLLRPVAVRDARIVVPRDWQAFKRTDYRIESAQSELSLRLSVHPRKIQGTTMVDAALRSSAITVRQRIVYDVAYERIAQLRFAIPEGVPAEQLRFFSSGGKELTSLVAPSTGQSPAEIRVPLESPAIGRFEIEVRFALDRSPAGPEAADGLISLPLIQSNDVVFSSTRFLCRDAAGRDVVVDGEGWLRQLAPDGLPVWVLSQATAKVPVRVAHLGGAPHGALVSKTLIQTRISLAGAIQSRARYRLAPGISELTVAFPPNLDPDKIWWNETEQRYGPATRLPDGTTEYEVLLPAGGDGNRRLLTIDYLAKSTVPARLTAAYTLEAPRLSEEQSPEQVRWQIVLPFQQLLFIEPAGYSPEYRWRSGRPFWSRESDLSIADLEQWIGADAGPSAGPGPVDGNRYVFDGYGPPPQLSFRAMSQSGIVLIGAGTALVLGLVLVKWPATRHVLTLLGAGFMISLLGVWFAAPVQVLLQPAVLGLLLATLAAAIDGYVKRRSRSVTVTLTSPSGFMTPSSSHPRSPAAGVGSNDFTSLRPPAETTRPPVEAARATGQLSESGNRT